MLVKTTLDEKQLDDLSEVTKENKALTKLTADDFGDLKFYRSKTNPEKKYLRVWETKPVPAGKTGAATYVVTFYEVVGTPAASLARLPHEVK